MELRSQPDFGVVFRALPGPAVILDPAFNIVEASDAYLNVAGKTREELLGRFIFDAFPENPDSPEARSVANLTASFQRVLQSKRPHRMPPQRYDTQIDDTADATGAPYEERYWQPVNSPILDAEGEVQWILHEVEEITEQMRFAYAGPGDGPLAREKRQIVDLLRQGNALLRDLPDDLSAQLSGHLTPTRLEAGAVLVEPSEPVETVHFPLYGLISVTRHLEDGSSVEVAVGGQGGLIGSSVLLGEPFEDTEARALVAGTTLSIRASTLREIMLVHPRLRTELSRYLPALLGQMSLSAACIARHSLDQRLARWLLTAASRTGSLELPLTQEPLAHILGVRRTGVSEALSRLEDAGIVSNRRGLIVIRDPGRLEARSCACFREAEERHARDASYLHARPLASSAEVTALTNRYFSLGADRPPADGVVASPSQGRQAARVGLNPRLDRE